MSEFLAEASVLIRPDTTKFRATLQAELNAATKGLVVPVPVAAVAPAGATAAAKEAAVATKTANTATQELVTTTRAATVSTLAQASAHQVQGAAARKAAVDTAKAAAAQEQLQRGAGATLLSLLGIRGATLAAGSQFLIGAAAVTVLAKSIKGASEDVEALAAVTRVLGEDLGKRLDAQADDLIGTFGLLDDEVLRFQSSLAQIFTSVGVTNEQTAKFAETLTKTAAEIAAFKDVPVEQTFKAIQSAVLGNLRGLRQLSIGLSATEIRQRALEVSGKEQVKNLTEQEIVLARYALILERTANLTGTFAEESERLAGQSKILRANIDALADAFGSLLLPAVEATVGAGNDLFTIFRELNERSKQKLLPDQFQDEANRFEQSVKDIADAALFFGPAALDALADSLIDTGDAAGLSAHQIGDFFDQIKLSGGFFQNFLDGMSQAEIDANALAGAMENLAQKTRLLNADIAGLSGQLLDIEFAGGGAGAEIANLERQLVKAQEAVAVADEAGKGQLAARRERNRIQDQITAIQEEEARKAEEAQRAAKSAADAAARAAEEARRANDQRVQDAIDQQQGAAELKIIAAQATAGLMDDIRAQVQFRNLLLRQIAGLAQQIKDTTPHRLNRALWNHIFNMWASDALFSLCGVVSLDLQPLAPEGGCAGWVLDVRTNLDGYQEVIV